MNVTSNFLSRHHIHLPSFSTMRLRSSCNCTLVLLGIWICIYGAVHHKYIVSPVAIVLLLSAHILAAKHGMIETCIVVMSGVIGAGVECVNLFAGIYQYTDSYHEPALLPTWVIMVWFLLGTTTRQVFHYLPKQIASQAIAGAVIGTSFYYVAAHMGAIIFTASNTPFSVIPVLLWSLAFPLIMYIGNRFFYNRDYATV